MVALQSAAGSNVTKLLDLMEKMKAREREKLAFLAMATSDL